MRLEKELIERSGDSCEMCGSKENLSAYEVPSVTDLNLYACSSCIEQMNDSSKIEVNHWRCLNEAIWSEQNSVKVMAYRMLNRIDADWIQDLLDMMYLEDDLLHVAKATDDGERPENEVVHRDVNGVVLAQGDSVVLIKDLKVKGSSLVAKQGTAVRNIRLDHQNSEYIEGKVDGQQIVLVTQFVKKL